MYLYSVKWGTTTLGATTYTWDWTDIQTDFRTTNVYLQAAN